ncbi:MAG: glutamine--fructose-6-phosphate transaminase (isomerizing) [Chloroflexota bacterium]
MCGIFGFVSSRPRGADVVLEGLRFLEYRGYDSWGVAVSHDGRIENEKATGKIAGAVTHLPDAETALGHTRWATHGGVTYANAHPHLDCAGRFALIHNGIVENHLALRESLHRDHRFASQTDTEVLAHMLEESAEGDGDLMASLLEVFRRVEGLSAIAVLDALTGQIVVAKNGSPLALGIADGALFLASDANALIEHTRCIMFLDDGQAASLAPDGVQVFDIQSGDAVRATFQDVAWDAQQAGLNGHAHFMDKEIHEQPRVLFEIAERKRQDAQELARLIERASDVYLIGCGTAHHAALSGRYMLAELAGIRAQSAVASEMSLIYPILNAGSLVIALSQSGETIDVLDAVKAARKRGATIAALTNAEGSALHRFADLTILLDCGPERCVLATKSYTAKLAVLHMTARAVCGDVAAGAEDVRRAAASLERLLTSDETSAVVDEVARCVGDHEHIFILGRHRNYPLALEAALKVKEVSYIHAEGFAAGELKHGVIALLTPGTPCFVLAPDTDFRREVLAAASEVRARGALTIGFSPQPEPEFDITINVSGGTSAPYEIAGASQLLAYRLALLRGCDPDKPRNLAKSVTVK